MALASGRTILSDPHFTSLLNSRSNVDLKDKWRNISVTALWKKAKLALKRALPPPKHDHDGNNNITALSIVRLANDDQRTNPTSPRPHGSKKSITSLDKIILEAITNLKEPRDSDRTSIFLYIEDNFKTLPNMKRHVAVRLKHLSSNGTITQARKLHKRLQEQLQRQSFASTEAEEAAKEADRAEAKAETAQIYAKAAVKALNFRISSNQSNLVKHKEAIMWKIL